MKFALSAVSEELKAEHIAFIPPGHPGCKREPQLMQLLYRVVDLRLVHREIDVNQGRIGRRSYRTDVIGEVFANALNSQALESAVQVGGLQNSRYAVWIGPAAGHISAKL